MLVVAIKPQGVRANPRVYATQSHVLEVLNALAQAAEKNESILFTPRLINGFHDENRLEEATVVVKAMEGNKFTLDDTVVVYYASGPEYYRMRQVLQLFSGLA